VPPDEERLAVFVRLVNELETPVEELLVDGLHALGRERAGVLDLLRAVRIGEAVQHAARPDFFLELGVLRIIGAFRLLLGVELIEIAEKFVEAVSSPQELVAVAEMVLAELPGDVAERLQ